MGPCADGAEEAEEAEDAFLFLELCESAELITEILKFCDRLLPNIDIVGDALVAKLKTETVNFLVWSYRMEEPKNLRDAWKQKHVVLLLMNAICDKDLSRTSRTSRTSMLKNNE